MRALQAVIVCGEQGKSGVSVDTLPCVALDQLPGLLFMQLKELPSDHGIGIFKIIGGKFLFLQEPDLAVRAIIRPADVVDAIHTLQVSADTVKPVRQLYRYSIEIHTPAL